MDRASTTRRLLCIFLLSIIESHHARSTTDSYPLLNHRTVNPDYDQSDRQLSSTIDPRSWTRSIAHTTFDPRDQDPIFSSGTVADNRYEDQPRDYENYDASEEDPVGPPDHVIPPSEHEEAKDVPTKPKYVVPGEWAKPPKDKDVQLEFVPTKLYAQVRGTHTVKRLPQEAAIESARSEEEKQNAARLKEVVTNSKVNTVYTEEGYEDSAYDHAGHIRDADFHEGYAKKLREQMDVRQKSKDDEEDDEEGGLADKGIAKIDPEEFKDYDDDYRDHEESRTGLRDGNRVGMSGNGDRSLVLNVDPKSVTVNGIGRLQDDLEREAEEIEKGLEINKIPKTSVSGEQDAYDNGEVNSVESRRNGNIDRMDQGETAKKKKKKRRRKPVARGQVDENFTVNPTGDAIRITPKGDEGYGDNRVATVVPIKGKSIPTDRVPYETTTLAVSVNDYVNGPPGLTEHGFDASSLSPTSSAIDTRQSNYEKPTTASYNQPFWNYYEPRKYQPIVTQDPYLEEPTTLNPLYPPGLYASVTEDRTAPSIIDPETLHRQRSFSPSDTRKNNYPSTGRNKNNRIESVNNFERPNSFTSTTAPWFLGEKDNDESRPPVTPLETPAGENSALSADRVSSGTPGITATKSEKISEQGGDDYDGSSSLSPTLSSLGHRPNYRVLVRHKPKKPSGSSERESRKEETPTSSPFTEQPIQTVSPEALPLDQKYLKVLAYVMNKNNENMVNLFPRNSGTNSFSFRNNENELEDLTRMRPPLPQIGSEVGYQNFLPDRPRRLVANDPSIENEHPRESDWNGFPIPREHYPRSNNFHGVPSVPVDPFTLVQPSSTRERNSLPATELLPPVPSADNDYARYQPTKEAEAYLIHAGNDAKQNRNLSRSLRYSPMTFDWIRRIRARRRKRRSAWRELDDEEISDVDGVDAKAVRSTANNGASNRDKAEGAGGNVWIERNSWRKVSRGKRGPDMSDLSAKQAIEKKSRFYANDRAGVSLKSLHKESDVVDERESRGDGGGGKMKNEIAGARDIGKGDGGKNETVVRRIENVRNEGEVKKEIVEKILGDATSKIGEGLVETVVGNFEEGRNKGNEMKIMPEKVENGSKVDNETIGTMFGHNENESKMVNDIVEVMVRSVGNGNRKKNEIVDLEFRKNGNETKGRDEVMEIILGDSGNGDERKSGSIEPTMKGNEDKRKIINETVERMLESIQNGRKHKNEIIEIIFENNEDEITMKNKIMDTILGNDRSRSKIVDRMLDNNTGDSNLFKRNETVTKHPSDPIINEPDVGKSTREKRSAIVERSSPSNQKKRRRGKTYEELLNESPKVTNDVIEKEINARFNKNEEKGNEEPDRDKEKVEVEVPDFDYVEELAEDEPDNVTSTTEPPPDREKYPFYDNKRIPSTSALKYAVNPGRIPTKTTGGMEFYESRDSYKHCDEVEPDLQEVVPKDEEPQPDADVNHDLPRLRGLGDKLDCFKSKYFDENPFDNPLFSESKVDEPTPPAEINPTEFSSRIAFFPKETDGPGVIQKPSKKPESVYRRSRKLATPTLRGDRQSIRLDHGYDPRTGRGRNGYLHSVRSAGDRSPRGTKKSRGFKSRPVDGVTEFSTVHRAAPYQSQVYEDVMGNIKHMADSYKVREESDDQVLNAASDGAKTRMSVVPERGTRKERKKMDVKSIRTTENPREGSTLIIEGLMPPKYSNKRYADYRRHGPQASKTGMHRPQTGSRIIGHYQKIRIHKRSVENDGSGKSRSSRESTTGDGNQTVAKEVADVTDGRSLALNNASNMSDLEAEGTVAFEEKIDASSMTAVPAGGRRKMKIPRNILTKNTSSDEQTNEESQRVVYTIRDRIRHSRPREVAGNVGKFAANETAPDVDRRRKEPRYNNVKRRKQQSVESTTVASLSSTDKFLPSESKVAVTVTPRAISRRIKVGREQSSEIIREMEDGQSNGKMKKLGSAENLKNYSSVEPMTDLNNESYATTSERTIRGYSVSENVEEEATTLRSPSSEIPPEFSRLNAFLESNPPGFTEAFPEETAKPSLTGELKPDDSEVVKQNEREEYRSDSKDTQPSDNSEEESSEEKVPNAEIKEADSQEEEDSSSEKDDSKEDRTFFTYNSRPYSPAENYEDAKYSDLGPRINKPAFYHPPFSMSYPKKRSSFEEYSEETDRSSDEREDEEEGKKEDYVFPWHQDKEEERKKRNDDRYGSIDKYEFPWERRERLARERRRKRKEEYRKYGRRFHDDDEDDEEEDNDGFESRSRTYVYPWERRDRSRNRYGGTWHDKDNSDAEESSSEHRPITRFSSRYNSKTFNFDDKPIGASSTRVEQISEPIVTASDNNAKDASESNEGGHDSSFGKTLESKNRGISRGAIIPESITLAPKKRSEKKDSKSGVRGEGRRSLIQLEKNNLDKSESQVQAIKTDLDQTADGRKDNYNTRQSKKRRRKPSSNTLFMETQAKPAGNSVKKTRRRQRLSTTTPATLVPDTSRSATTSSTSRIARRKSHKAADDSKKNNVPRAAPTNDWRRDKGDEKSSKGSDKKIIPRTRYPSASARKSGKDGRSRKSSSTISKDNERSSVRERDDIGDVRKTESAEEILIESREKSEGDERPKETKGNSEFPGISLPIDADFGDRSPAEHFGMKSEEAMTLNDFATSDVIPESDEFGSVFKSEIPLAANLLRSVIPTFTKNSQIGGKENREIGVKKKQNNERDNHNVEMGKNVKEELDSVEEGESEKLINSRMKIIKDPQQRLYYYVEERRK